MSFVARSRALLALAAVVLISAVAVIAQESAAPPSGRTATSEELSAYLAELGRRAQVLESLRVRFRQAKSLKILRRPRISTAELSFAGGKLAIVTRGAGGEIESRLVAAESELKIYYPALARLEVFPAPAGVGGADAGGGGGAAGASGATLPLFTGDWKRLDKEYAVAMRFEEGGGKDGAGAQQRVRLTLTPRHEKGAVARIEMLLADYRVKEYVQEERSGSRVRMEILEWEPNAEVPAEAFTLEVPEGTKVVRVGGQA